MYDLLGFAAPFFLNAKLILQDLCRSKYDWDDKIPDEYLQRWQAWLQELPKLEQLTIERCFKSPDLGEIASCQLHHFSDASQQAYGAVTYLKITDHDGNVSSSFVMGKSRLAPIKPQFPEWSFQQPYYHLISGHSGLEYTLSLTRQKYWIINGRFTVRSILNECFSCRKRQAPTAQQKMAKSNGTA